MLDHNTAEDILRREVLDLAIAQLAQERRLAGTVGAENTIAPAADEAQSGMGEEQQGTVGQ